VGTRASVDNVEKRKFLIIQGLEFRPLGRPARSQSLSRLLAQRKAELLPHSFIVFQKVNSGSHVTRDLLAQI
jgi:hypothetical protein